MATNPYAPYTKDTRYDPSKPWKQSKANQALVFTDYLHHALLQIMDPDNPELALSLTPGSVVSFPDSVESGTDENAQRVIFVDLDDPAQMWDLDAFMQQAQATSWYAELGAPPIHGAMWINEAKTNLIWWDREAGSIYMQFDGGVGNMMWDASPLMVDVFTLDGRIFIAGTGGIAVAIIDLLTDGSRVYKTSGLLLYQGDISNRNAGSAYTAAVSSTPAIINGTVNAIAACRDPELVDEFGRPKHWWAAGTDGGTSIYSPVGDAIYDSVYVDDSDAIDLSGDGQLTFHRDQATLDYVYSRRTIYAISADAFAEDFAWASNGTDAQDTAWASAAIVSDFKTLPGRSWASAGAAQIWFCSDEGMYIAHVHVSDNPGKGGLIRLHEDYASPYMKGDCRAAWPLHAVTDVSPAGHNLTNNNTVTFASGGPAGSYADFVASSSMSLSLADHADFGSLAAFSVGCWIYRDVDSGAIEGLVHKWDNGSATDRTFRLWIAADDTINFATENASDALVTVTGPAIALSTWYYVLGTYDGTTQKLHLNGELVASGAQTGSLRDSGEVLSIGAGTSADVATQFFDGRIGGLVISATVMTVNEIKAEYTRGLRRLSSTIDTNDTISDNDVASLAADPHGRYVAAIYDDKVVQVFDEYGVPVISDTYPGTTARDVAVKSMPGATTPHLIMAGSDQIEFVQADTKIQG